MRMKMPNKWIFGPIFKPMKSSTDKPSTGVLFHEDGVYMGWPHIIKRLDGSLLVSFAGGGKKAHVDPYGDPQLIKSTDNGQTWVKENSVSLMNTVLDDGCTIFETKAKTLIMTRRITNYFWKDPNHQPPNRPTDWDTYYISNLDGVSAIIKEWEDSIQLSNTPYWPNTGNTYPLSNCLDYSYSFRNPFDPLTNNNTNLWNNKYPKRAHNVHGLAECSDGSIMSIGEGFNPNNAWGFQVEKSKNDGRTWNWISTIPFYPSASCDDWSEATAIECMPDYYLAMFRNNNADEKQRYLGQSVSVDGGLSWTPIQRILAPPGKPDFMLGLPPSLLKLSNGNVAVVYSDRRHPYKVKVCFCYKTSNNSWIWSNEIVAATFSNNPGVAMHHGYPSAVEVLVPDANAPSKFINTLLIVFYHPTPSEAQLGSGSTGSKTPINGTSIWATQIDITKYMQM